MSSADCTALVGVMQKAAAGVLDAAKLFSYMEGEVTGTDPLKIRVDQKLELVEEQLILTNAVRDHYVFMETYDNEKDSDQQGDGYHVTEKQNQDHRHNFMDATTPAAVPNITDTQSGETDHDHNYKGGVVKMKYGLKRGEKVHLLQVDGGQHFIVLDRKDPPKGKEGSD